MPTQGPFCPHRACALDLSITYKGDAWSSSKLPEATASIPKLWEVGSGPCGERVAAQKTKGLKSKRPHRQPSPYTHSFVPPSHGTAPEPLLLPLLFVLSLEPGFTPGSGRLSTQHAAVHTARGRAASCRQGGSPLT